MHPSLKRAKWVRAPPEVPNLTAHGGGFSLTIFSGLCTLGVKYVNTSTTYVKKSNTKI